MITRDEIIKMAQEAGFQEYLLRVYRADEGIERFFRAAYAAGVAAEREACAKVCEETDIVDFEHCMVLHQDAAKTLTNAAAAIRARGEK